MKLTPLILLICLKVQAVEHQVSCAVLANEKRTQFTLTANDQELRSGRGRFRLDQGGLRMPVQSLTNIYRDTTRLITRWGDEVGIPGRIIINALMQTERGEVVIKKAGTAKLDEKNPLVRFPGLVSSTIGDFEFQRAQASCYHRIIPEKTTAQ